MTDGCVHGHVIIGNNHRNKTGYYGEYPPTLLELYRVIDHNDYRVAQSSAAVTQHDHGT